MPDLSNCDSPEDAARRGPALALEEALHEEHRRSLAILLDLPPDADWLRVTRRITQLKAGRETWKTTAEEIERDRDEKVAALETEVQRLGDRVRKARKTNQRINRRAQKAESALLKTAREVSAFHEGEVPPGDEATRSTPAQFVWKWNRWTPERRLEVAGMLLDAQSEAERNFLGNAAWLRDQLDQVQARVRAAMALHTPTNTYASAMAGEPADCPLCGEYPCATVKALTSPPRWWPHITVRRWRPEHFDPLAEEWMASGSSHSQREDALRMLRMMASDSPQWAEGEPVSRRLVEEKTTYTAEDIDAADA